MAWTPIYADEEDFKIICDWLNGEEEIAYLVANGDKKWIAKTRLDTLTPEPVQQYQLWHIPSGPLPLLGETNKDPDGIVENPWEGWTEKRTGAHYWVPYFGAGHPGIITLTVKTVGREATESIGLSDFGWIGNWYRIVGSAAHPTTDKFWQKLKRWIKKQAVRIPRRGPLDGPDPEIWTFPSAHGKIENGMHRDMNP
jgi:hypothetical protein